MFSINIKFLKNYMAIVLPLVATQFVYIGLNFVDNIMVGRLGEESIAAVGFANKLYFIYVVTNFGIFGGSSIFMAQFYGKRNFVALRKVFALVVLVGLIISIFFTGLSLVFAEWFMWMFSSDNIVIKMGTDYLMIIALSFPFMALSFAITTALRSMGKTKEALYITIVATSVNTVLNYLLIYGNGGFPELQTGGAAIATVIARVIECLLCLYLLLNRRYHLRTTLKRYFGLSKTMKESIIKISIPVFLTESIWVISTTLLYVAYAQLGTTAGASVNIGELVVSMGSIVFFGVATGANVLIAQTIGAGDHKEAFLMGKRIIVIATIMSLFCTILALLLINPILSIYVLSEEARQMTKLVLISFSIAMFFKMINWTMIVGVLRSGGDTKVTLFIDALPIVFIAIPSAFFCAVYLKLPVHIVVLIANFEEVLKIFVALHRFISKKWIKDLT